MINHTGRYGWVRHTLDISEQQLKAVGELEILDGDLVVLKNFDNTKVILPHITNMGLDAKASNISEIEFTPTEGFILLDIGTNIVNIEELKNKSCVFIEYSSKSDVRICSCCSKLLNEGTVHICMQKKFDSVEEAFVNKDMSFFTCKPRSL